MRLFDLKFITRQRHCGEEMYGGEGGGGQESILNTGVGFKYYGARCRNARFALEKIDLHEHSSLVHVIER